MKFNILWKIEFLNFFHQYLLNATNFLNMHFIFENLKVNENFGRYVYVEEYILKYLKMQVHYRKSKFQF